MADFYQKVATPQTQYRQPRQYSGPSVDVNAHAQAQNDYNNNIGSAIQNLIGAASSVNSIVKQNNKRDEQRMIAEHSLDAQADAYGVATHIHNSLKAQAEKDGRSLEDYSDQEIKGFADKAQEDYVKAHKLSDKKYFTLTQKVMEHKKQAVVLNTLKTNEATIQQKRITAVTRQFQSAYKGGASAADMIDGLKATIDTNIGFTEKTRRDANGDLISYMPELQMSQGELESKFLANFMNMAIVDKDINAVEMMNSKEFKEYFKDNPAYKQLAGAAAIKVQSAVNKEKQLNFDKIEEFTYNGLENNIFEDSKAANAALDEQLKAIPERFRPSSKEIHRLRENINKEMKVQDNFIHYYGSLRGGDYTVLERSDLSRKDKDAVLNKYFSSATGITDTSAQGITQSLLSGKDDISLKAYLNSGNPAPKVLKDWANQTPTGGFEGMKQKALAISHLTSIAKGATTSVFEIIKPKNYAKLMYVSNLQQDIESGILDNKQASVVYEQYNNDIRKNVDAYGTYISKHAAEVKQTSTNKEWRQNLISDAPYTYDENQSQEYLGRQVDKFLGYALDIKGNQEDAQDLAENMLRDTHQFVENPDGTETVLPYGWKNKSIDDLVKLADNLPEFKQLKDVAGYLGYGKEYDFHSRLSFTPNLSFEKNRLMDFKYDGTTILSMTAKDFEYNMDELNKQNILNAENRNMFKTQGYTGTSPIMDKFNPLDAGK